MIRFLALMLVSSMALAEPPHDNHCKYGCDNNPNRNADDGPRNPNGADPANNSGGGNNGSGGGPDTPSGDVANHSGGGAGGSGSADSQIDTSVEVAGDDNRVDSKNTATNTAQGGSTQTDIEITREYEAVAEAVHSLNLAHCAGGGSAGDKSASFNLGGMEYTCEVSRGMAVLLLTINKDNPSDVRLALSQAKAVRGDLYDYLRGRAKTAWVGSASRDLLIFFAILLITGVPAI